MDSVIPSRNDLTRRDFLVKAVVGLGSAAGLGAVLGRVFSGRDSSLKRITLPEDSIFMPRADQRKRVLGE